MCMTAEELISDLAISQCPLHVQYNKFSVDGALCVQYRSDGFRTANSDPRIQKCQAGTVDSELFHTRNANSNCEARTVASITTGTTKSEPWLQHRPFIIAHSASRIQHRTL